jgi:hypothetical protein
LLLGCVIAALAGPLAASARVVASRTMRFFVTVSLIRFVYGWLPGPPWLWHELGRSALGPVH